MLTFGPAPAEAAEIDKTRFIIGLPHEAEFEVFSLTNPNRVIVEMKTTTFRLPPLPKNGPVGFVDHFQGGKAGNGKSRVVISVTAPVVVETAKVTRNASGQNPQLELDIVRATPVIDKAARAALAAKFDRPFSLGAGGLAASQPPTPRPALSPQQQADRTDKPVIVIDPGHGGHDSGAKKHGVVEKDVVLKFSHVLRRQLEATGLYRVLMTRTDDTFVPLGERRAFAERNNAELFIAVHADYARSSARGATVYSLRDGVARRLKGTAKSRVKERVANNEMRKFAKGGQQDKNVVKNILDDLVKREVEVTDHRTDMVSRSLVQYMGNSTNLRKTPHKTAAFKVLKTQELPSVLVELAFVSNKSDAKLLTSQSWREKVSASMVKAINRYFSSAEARMPI